MPPQRNFFMVGLRVLEYVSTLVFVFYLGFELFITEIILLKFNLR